MNFIVVQYFKFSQRIGRGCAAGPGMGGGVGAGVKGRGEGGGRMGLARWR